MIRNAFLKSARYAVIQGARRPRAIGLGASSKIFVPSSRSVPTILLAARCYSAPATLSKSEVEGRIVDLLKNFDKVTDPTKLSPTSHFANDLGLDSLDTVEVVMAIEEEFSIEIPDKDADAIHSVDKAVEYILGQPDAH